MNRARRSTPADDRPFRLTRLAIAIGILDTGAVRRRVGPPAPGSRPTFQPLDPHQIRSLR